MPDPSPTTKWGWLKPFKTFGRKKALVVLSTSSGRSSPFSDQVLSPRDDPRYWRPDIQPAVASSTSRPSTSSRRTRPSMSDPRRPLSPLTSPSLAVARGVSMSFSPREAVPFVPQPEAFASRPFCPPSPSASQQAFITDAVIVIQPAVGGRTERSSTGYPKGMMPKIRRLGSPRLKSPRTGGPLKPFGGKPAMEALDRVLGIVPEPRSSSRLSPYTRESSFSDRQVEAPVISLAPSSPTRTESVASSSSGLSHQPHSPRSLSEAMNSHSSAYSTNTTIPSGSIRAMHQSSKATSRTSLPDIEIDGDYGRLTTVSAPRSRATSTASSSWTSCSSSPDRDSQHSFARSVSAAIQLARQISTKFEQNRVAQPPFDALAVGRSRASSGASSLSASGDSPSSPSAHSPTRALGPTSHAPHPSLQDMGVGDIFARRPSIPTKLSTISTFSFISSPSSSDGEDDHGSAQTATRKRSSSSVNRPERPRANSQPQSELRPSMEASDSSFNLSFDVNLADHMYRKSSAPELRTSPEASCHFRRHIPSSLSLYGVVSESSSLYPPIASSNQSHTFCVPYSPDLRRLSIRSKRRSIVSVRSLPPAMPPPSTPLPPTPMSSTDPHFSPCVGRISEESKSMELDRASPAPSSLDLDPSNFPSVPDDNDRLTLRGLGPETSQIITYLSPSDGSYLSTIASPCSYNSDDRSVGERLRQSTDGDSLLDLYTSSQMFYKPQAATGTSPPFSPTLNISPAPAGTGSYLGQPSCAESYRDSWREHNLDPPHHRFERERPMSLSFQYDTASVRSSRPASRQEIR